MKSRDSAAGPSDNGQRSPVQVKDGNFMIQRIVVAAALGLAALAPSARAQVTTAPATTSATSPSSDTIRSTLDDRKAEHTQAIERARERLLKVIEARAQAAAEKGDLTALKILDEAKQTFDLEGKLPESLKDASVLAANKAYSGAVKGADTVLSRAYEQAIRDYTRARKIADAEAVRAEGAELGLPASGAGAGGGDAGGGSNRIKLSEKNLPSFLESNPKAFSEGPGLQFEGDNVIRTRDGTWLNQDFTLDLLYSYKPGAAEIGVIGFGEGWNRRNVLELRMHSPGLAEGHIAVRAFGAEARELAKMASEGPHLLRFEKKGDVLTASLCIDYKDTFTADVTREVTDIKKLAPYLTAKNTYLFFGRPGIIYREIRLVKSR